MSTAFFVKYQYHWHVSHLWLYSSRHFYRMVYLAGAFTLSGTDENGFSIRSSLAWLPISVGQLLRTLIVLELIDLQQLA